jgi:hypothetical protein
MARFVVVELEGFAALKPSRASQKPGLSVCVLDTAINCRLIGEFKSERLFTSGRSVHRTHDQAVAEARARAAELAAELNARWT